MTSGPVRGNRRVGMLSGPVSDISVGPVTSGHPMSGGGSITQNSAGAVKQEMDHSLGERVYDAQRALGPLQQRLRAQQDAAEAGAAESDLDTAEQHLDVSDVDQPQEEVDLDTPEATQRAPAAAAADDPSMEAPESEPLPDTVEDAPRVDETTN